MAADVLAQHIERLDGDGFTIVRETFDAGLADQLTAQPIHADDQVCGFGIHRGLIGHIDGKPPSAVVLGSKLRQAMIWDRV